MTMHLTPDLYRLHQNFVGKEVTRFENQTFGERFGIITDVIEDDYSCTHCAVILWDDDENVTFDEEGFECVDEFCPVDIVQISLLQEGQMYEVYYGV